MKALNNPWIVGGLCVIAAGALGYQVFSSGGRRGISFAPVAPVSTSVAPRPSTLNPQASTTSAQTSAIPSRIERSYLQSHLAQWTEAPPRDPVLLATAAEHGAAPTSPVSQWKLKAIWHQTGSRLAFINKGVYAEGDVIEGYTLDAIESDGVWFRGQHGREGLGFVKPQPITAAPAAGDPIAVK